MSTKITHDEWMAELNRLADAKRADGITGDEGFASEDMAKSMNVGPATASKIIGEMIDRGQVEHAGYQNRPNRIGQRKRVPVYRIVKPNKKGRKR